MDKKIKLSPRLAAVAKFIPKGAKVVDVGTDHAYVPIWLIQNERALTPVYAFDINSGPLERAKFSALQYGVAGKIQLRLCAGLTGTDGTLANTVVIAGMGGENIAGIIKDSGWKWNAAHSLVLQPMTKIPELCSWLYGSGFHIEDERLVRDCGEIYRVMLVKYGAAEMPDKLELYTGHLRSEDELAVEYLEKLIKKFQKAEKGMSKGKQFSSRAEKIRILIEKAKLMESELKLNDGYTDDL